MKNKFILFTFSALTLFLNSCENINDKTSSDISQKIAGHWSCVETSSEFKSTSSTETYWVDISSTDTDSTLVLISNFYNLGRNTSAEAKINNYNITLVNASISGGFSVRGSGTITPNLQTINWIYYVDDGSGKEDEVTATYTFSY